jgi:hypothetical protein
MTENEIEDLTALIDKAINEINHLNSLVVLWSTIAGVAIGVALGQLAFIVFLLR